MRHEVKPSKAMPQFFYVLLC